MRSLMPTTSLILLLTPLSDAQNACTPCVGGEDPDSNREHCSDLQEVAAGLTGGGAECSAFQLENFQLACCDTAPRDCSLCPDGSSFVTSRKLPNFVPGEEDLTCIDINSDPAFLEFMNNAGVCEDTLLRRSAAWCGCPGVPRECFLCQDGSVPPNRGLVDNVYYDWNCRTFDYVSSYFSPEECAGLSETILEFDAAAFCGCEGSSPPQVCSLCPEGTHVVDPDIPIEGNTFTCQDLALSTSFIPAVAPCVRVKSTYRGAGILDLCCVKSGAAGGLISWFTMLLTGVTVVARIML